MVILVRLIIFPLAEQRQEVRLGKGEQGGEKIRQESSYPTSSSSLRTMTVHLNRRLVKRFRFPAKSCQVLSCRHSNNESEAKYICIYFLKPETTLRGVSTNLIFFFFKQQTTQRGVSINFRTIFRLVKPTFFKFKISSQLAQSLLKMKASFFW